LKGNFRFRTILPYSPLLLCVVSMLPRLLSPQFGFFDDSYTLINAHKIWSGQWTFGGDIANFRFRPLYWLFYALIDRLFGDNPFWFFMGNLFLGLIITFCLIRLARRLGLDNQTAWVVGFTFVISGPILENTYTLSKPELQQTGWILLLLLTCTCYPYAGKIYWRIASLLAMAGLTLAATLTKETGVLLLPASILSLLIAWGRNRANGRPDHPAVQQRGALALGVFLGILVYVILYKAFIHNDLLNNGASFSNSSRSWIIGQARLLFSWLRRDYLYLLPITLMSVPVLFRKTGRDRLLLLLECFVWLGLWTMVYLPAGYMPEYYLLPAAAIAALMCGICFSAAIEALHGTFFTRSLAWCALGLSTLLLLITIPSQVANARMQLAIDRANADMLAYVVKHAAQESTLWININPPNEYVTEFFLWVNLLQNRPDIRVDYFHSQNLAAAQAQGREVWIVSPYMENQFYPSVRVGMTELPARQWNEVLDQYLAGRGMMVNEPRQSFRSSNLDPLRFFCPLARSLSYCQVPDAPLDQRVFAYGWRIIRVP